MYNVIVNNYVKEFNSVTEADNNKCAELWDKLAPEMRQVCIAKMKGYTNDVDDLVSDAFVALCKRVTNKGFPDNPKAWLYATLSNKINQCFKQKYNDEKHLYFPNTEQIELPYTHDFVDDIVNNDTLSRANKLIDALDRKDQIIIDSFYFKNKSMKEIAEILNSTVTAVKQKRYRLINDMRATLNIKKIK